jgi:tetratricopeptide (TPR) repeat protein
VLEGSVQKENNSLRINAQLIDARSGDHVWADRYSYPDASDLFAIQDSIVDEVVKEIVGNINPEKLALVTHSVRTTNMEAQELYWKGVETYGEECETKEVCDESRKLFQQALALDPGFARAHGWLAYVIAQGWYHGFYEEVELQTASRHAKRAVELDGKDFENHWSLAEVQHRMGDVDAAYASFRTAMSLNGNDADLLANWSEILNKMGQQAQALETIEDAFERTPRATPDYFYWYKAFYLYFMKKHQESLDTLDMMKDEAIWAGALRAANLARLARTSSANKEMDKYLKDTGGEWTLETEYVTEAATFKDFEDAFYWLEGLWMAGMPKGDNLPDKIAARLPERSVETPDPVGTAP